MRLLIVCVVFTSPPHETFSRHLREAFSKSELLIIHRTFRVIHDRNKLKGQLNGTKKISLWKIYQIFLIECYWTNTISM